MGSTQPSVLRQAILGQPPEMNDVPDPAPPLEDDEPVFPWEKTRDKELGSAVVSLPPVAPVPRTAPGHAGHMKLLFENAPVAMAMFDVNMCYLLANRRWLEDFKLTEVEITGRSHYELFPTLHPGWRHVYERALGGQIVRSDRDAITQDGRPVIYRWEVRPWRHVDTTIGGVMISCERLYAVANHQGPAADKSAGSSSGESLWQSRIPMLAMTAEGRIVRASKGVAPLLRVGSPGGGALQFWQAFASPEKHEVLHRHVLASLNSVLADAGRPHAVIFTEANKADNSIPTQWMVTRMYGGIPGIPGELALVIGLPGLSPFSPTAGDLALREDGEIKRLKEELAQLHVSLKTSSDSTSLSRQREMRLRAVLDLAPCGIMVLDNHAKPIYRNAHVASLLGRDLREGATIEEWLAEGARDAMHHAEIARRWGEGVWRKNLTLPLALTGTDGLLKEIEMRPVPLPGGGLLVMMQDVTESRRSEEMLRSTEAKYRTLVHESPVPIILADRSAAVFDVNPAAEAFLGHTRADLRRMSLDSWLDAESLALRAATLQEMQDRGERSAAIPIRVLHRSGESSPAELRLSLVTDVSGQLLFSVHFFSPVHEEKPEVSHPAPLAPPPATVPSRSQSHTEALLLLTTDGHGRIQEWTDDAAERFGYESSEVVGRGLHVLFRPSDATGFYGAVHSIANQGSDTVEWTFFHKTEGRMKGPFVLRKQREDSLAISLLEELIVIAPTIVHRDATPAHAAVEEAQGAFESLSASEEESQLPTEDHPLASLRVAPPVKPSAEELSRERLLLGETHHRVKNHLQIITSMLNLQMSTLHNDEARDALRSSQNRVRSIAALHQHLFRLTTGETSDFRSFAIGLIAHLRECYQVPDTRVQLQLDVPPQTVPEEWLMPLALALNEMVSNAFKHAFPKTREGHMRIALSWNDQEGELTVVDDGVGLPNGFSHHDTAGLGLKILRVFAGQLGGEVEVHSAPGQGAVFQLKFPVSSDSEDFSSLGHS